MNFIEVDIRETIATVVLHRGKVNALNNMVVDELRARLLELEADRDVNAILLTGHGRFFSFGFDIPEFLSFTKAEFTDYIVNFTGLYTYLFQYPKPVVAALNGHTIGGGCMLALACDHRVMVEGNTKISLNEITFGASIFAGSMEMLRFLVGNANATRILYSGDMYCAKEAMRLGLVQAVATGDDLIDQAQKIAADLAAKPLPAFASIKSLLRKPVADEMMRRERESIRAFVDIWYSEATRANIRKIKIY